MTRKKASATRRTKRATTKKAAKARTVKQKIMVVQMDTTSAMQIIALLEDPKQWTVTNFSQVINAMRQGVANAVETEVEAQLAAVPPPPAEKE